MAAANPRETGETAVSNRTDSIRPRRSTVATISGSKLDRIADELEAAAPSTARLSTGFWNRYTTTRLDSDRATTVISSLETTLLLNECLNPPGFSLFACPELSKAVVS